MPPNPPQSPNSDDIEDLIDRGVTRALVRIGIASYDDKDAVELQKDFSYLRDLRIGSQAIKNKGLLGVIGLVVTGLTTLIWFVLSDFFTKHGVPVPPPPHP